MNIDSIQAGQVAMDVITLALLSFRQHSPERAYAFEQVMARDPQQFDRHVYVDENCTVKRVEVEIKASEFYEDFARALSNLDPEKEALRARTSQLVPVWFTRSAP